MISPPANPFSPPERNPTPEIDRVTWAPFQSQVVRTICANMTDAEKKKTSRRGLLYGVWVAISLMLPLQILAMRIYTERIGLVVSIGCGLLIVTHLACIPIWLRSQRQFLGSTDWSRENQIDAKSIPLFRSRKSR